MPERLEDVAILIDGNRWRAWETVTIKTLIDGLSSITFSTPFEPDRAEFRDTFRPFAFRDLELLVGDERMFTGTLVDVRPSRDPKSTTVDASAYSRPAVLNDVHAPARAFPLELDGLTLRQVAEKLVGPFGIDVEVEGDDGPPFRRVGIKPTQKVFGFLAELAKERGLVISDTPEGALRFRRSSSPGQPVVRLREGQPPLLSVEPSFAPQAYYSEVTAISKTRAGRGGAKYTVTNPRLAGVLRPHTFELEDTDGPDAPAAADAKLGRMFGNALSLSCKVHTWRDPGGQLWRPDTTLLLEAPGAMVYQETEWLVHAVTLDKGEAQTASLALVLPGAFSGEIPEVMPWD
ncbi:MAG: hypothetical protein ACOC9T_00515 [Myxococcota bacterium]